MSWQVYRGTLTNGQLIAVKKGDQGSVQGDLEFKTEIELLSRVHHKNVVKWYFTGESIRYLNMVNHILSSINFLYCLLCADFNNGCYKQ